MRFLIASFPLLWPHLLHGEARQGVYVSESIESESFSAESFSSPFDVPHGYSAKTDFSPEIKGDFIGIKISAPKTVSRRAEGGGEEGASIPISIAYQFTAAYKIKYNPIAHHMVVVAVNARTGASFTSTLQDDDPAPRADEGEEIPAEDLENTFFEEYLTIDLAQFLKLPEKDAVYHVHVTLEKHQSNVVKIEIRKKGK